MAIDGDITISTSTGKETIMDIFKAATSKGKWISGPGGWLCPCCGPKQKDRPKARRYARRVIKLNDKIQFIEE